MANIGGCLPRDVLFQSKPQHVMSISGSLLSGTSLSALFKASGDKKSLCVLRLWKFMFELTSVSVGSMECRWVYAVLTALWNIFEKTKYEMEVGNIEICAVFSCICQKLKLFLNFKGEIRLEITVNMELILKRDIKRVFLTGLTFFMKFLHISHSWTDL